MCFFEKITERPVSKVLKIFDLRGFRFLFLMSIVGNVKEFKVS